MMSSGKLQISKSSSQSVTCRTQWSAFLNLAGSEKQSYS